MPCLFSHEPNISHSVHGSKHSQSSQSGLNSAQRSRGWPNPNVTVVMSYTDDEFPCMLLLSFPISHLNQCWQFFFFFLFSLVETINVGSWEFESLRKYIIPLNIWSSFVRPFLLQLIINTCQFIYTWSMHSNPNKNFPFSWMFSASYSLQLCCCLQREWTKLGQMPWSQATSSATSAKTGKWASWTTHSMVSPN